ncbi:MAG TPA: hypothetical protein HA367_08470 [Candidatus Methanofastidiosum sp.]|nr:hypothetical protein [Methanofastidiosum sp.]
MEFKDKVIKEIERDVIKKYLIILLGLLNNEPISGKTRLMKELFFISKNIPLLEEETEFEKDNYGPNSDNISISLEDLEVLGLIVNPNNNYQLTKIGKEIFHLVIPTITNEELKIIENMKDLFYNLTNDEVLGLVYSTYPEMTEVSLVKERINQKKIDIAISLLKKGKVSMSKASEISGLTFSSFYKILKEKGVKVEIEI